MKFHSHSIQTLIFDLGGVLLNIDFSLTQYAFAQLGMNNAETVFGKYSQKDFFDELDKGYISENELFDNIKQLLHHNVTDQQIRDAWNAMILDFPKKRIDLLLHLKNKYNIYLLSNTNATHFELYSKQLYDNYKLTFDDLFHKAYLSFECGMRKPDAEFFMKLIHEQHIHPHHTLFFDDTEMHINAAIGLNIHSVHIKDAMDICDFFDNWNCFC